MMACGHYHITYCQILETEHRLKLASILKLFNTTGTPEIGLKEFLASFSSSVEEYSDSNLNLTNYIIELKDISFIQLDLTNFTKFGFCRWLYSTLLFQTFKMRGMP